ncbi:MAG: hypothetical protein WC071_11475 [Victivallaceae bacterium]
MTDHRTVEKYLVRSGFAPRPVEPEEPARKYRAAVVIPTLGEFSHLPNTLRSLAENSTESLAEIMVLAVINNSDAAETDMIADNQRTLAALRKLVPEFCGGLIPGENLFWIDASSPGREISRNGGVGEARKIGMDQALTHLDFRKKPLLFCLDADTLVRKDYLTETFNYFSANPNITAAVVRFEHRFSDIPEETGAIITYELFMHYYIFGLRLAGSPYACHALGSATVCTADAYVKAGGMRPRNAGEDFYFIQAALKTGAVGEVTGTRVFPSCRPSSRVPFGTGPRIRAILAGQELLFYHPDVFAELGKMFSIVNNAKNIAEFESLPALFKQQLSVIAWNFLAIENNFESAWLKIFRNTRKDIPSLLQAFHVWFDAFKTLKFIHYCENTAPAFARLPAMEAFSKLCFNYKINIPFECLSDQLQLLEYLRETNIFAAEKN